MNNATSTTPDVACLLREIREARFSHGLACVRCGSGAIVRWGRFAGRQRYRCRFCHRTFSDLTGTPVAYAKRLAVLPDYRECLRRSLSLRASARAVAVHLTTSFRWRHRLLAGALAEEATLLSGLIEVEDARVLCADLRPRTEGRRARRRSIVRRPDQPSWLFGMRDRTGRSITGYTGERRPDTQWWEWMFSEFIDGQAVIITRGGPLSDSARAASALGIPVWSSARSRPRGATDLLCHTSGVASMLQRFRRWLRRFRGVSSKYLDNYVLWYGLLDPLRRRERGFGSMFSWPLGPPRSPNSLREQTPSAMGRT